MIKIRCTLTLLVSILFFVQSAFAQSGLSITGQVSDSNGYPMPGVSIIIKGTSNGVVTDFDGNYVLEGANKGDILVYSYLGMETQEMLVDTALVINVVMKDLTTDLEQVVVVGYGTSRKKDLTGSVVSISAESIEEQPLANVDQAIQGQISGVSVTRSSGQPGGAVSVRVRGITSATGSNEPLYIIDGVNVTSAGSDSFDFSQFGGGGGQTQVSPLSTLNPSDIESIQVLKDASAAAIYGSQASNGVVIITTKRGKSGKAKFTYEAYGGLQTAPRFYDMMNLREFAQFSNEVREEALGQEPFAQFANPALLGSGTDWQREIFRGASITNHQLSISGGKDNTKFYTSLSYFDQEGIVINSDFRRYGIRLNLDHKYNEWIKFGNNINFSNTLENVGLNDVDNGIIASALRQSPDIPVRLSDGTFGSPNPEEGFGSFQVLNPVAWSEIRNALLERYKINGNFFAEVKLFKGLTFKSDIGYDYNTTKSEAFNPTYEFGSNINSIATSVKSFGQSFFWLFKNYFTYNTTFGNNSLNVLAGTEAQKATFEGVIGQRSNFPSNDVTGLDTGDADTSVASSYKGENSLLSFFGRINYNYDSRYFLSGSLRYDGSSRFGPGRRWGVFPSVSAAWVISEEAFLQDNEVLSWLKLRAGIGSSGNQNVGNNLFRPLLRNDPTPFGPGFTLQGFANPDITWESLVSPNVGLELGFLGDKIRLDVDLYEKVSSDFLALRPLPSVFGTHNSENFLGINPPTVNFGEMRNTGIDVTLKTQNFSKDKFKWTTNIVVSAYRNEVTELVNEGDIIQGTFGFGQELTRTIAGEPIGQFYGFVTDGIIRTQDELNNAPLPEGGQIDETSGTWLGDLRFVDTNEDGVINDDDKQFIGSPHPDFTYSITNEFTIGNFDLSIFLQGSQGNDVFNWTRILTEGMRELSSNQAAVVADRYRPSNPNGSLPRFSNGNPNGNDRISDRFVEDASYLRIQSVTLGWNLPRDMFGENAFFNKLRVYGTLQNLYTFTGYSGYDPEVGAFNQSAILSGVDNGRYPVPRTVTVGLNVQF